jgi:hypothetical protein
MFDNLNFKKKVNLLIAGFCISLLIVYYIAVKGTIDLARECHHIQDQITTNEKAPAEIKIFEKRLIELNKTISNLDSSNTDFHENILGDISTYCTKHDLIIKNYPESHKYASDKYVVETDIISIEGNFSDLLKLLYKLEIENKNGHISSISFETIPDHRNGVYKLNLIIYEQNIYQNQKFADIH